MVKKGGKKTVSKTEKTRWKIGSALILLFFTAVAGFIFWFSYTGSTKEIIAIADQFKPDPSWELKSEAIEPPRTFCVDIECPSVWRQWRTNKPVTHEELTKILTAAKWDLEISRDCDFKITQKGENIKVCSAKGIIEKYSVTITFRTTNTSQDFLVGLNVEKE